MTVDNLEKKENLVTRLVVEKLIPHGICKEAYKGFYENEYLLIGKTGYYGYAAPDKKTLITCLFHNAEIDENGNYIFSCKWDEERSTVHIYDKNFSLISVTYT